MFVDVSLPQNQTQQHADRATGEREQRHERGENACGRRIGRLTAVAANVAVAGAAATAVGGSYGAMGDDECQECHQVDGDQVCEEMGHGGCCWLGGWRND